MGTVAELHGAPNGWLIPAAFPAFCISPAMSPVTEGSPLPVTHIWEATLWFITRPQLLTALKLIFKMLGVAFRASVCPSSHLPGPLATHGHLRSFPRCQPPGCLVNVGWYMLLP